MRTVFRPNLNELSVLEEHIITYQKILDYVISSYRLKRKYVRLKPGTKTYSKIISEDC